ncbi:MAG: hypothetical protein EOP09_17125 [Proteobacteria bacterium]|nr:MAG: hypothetical protein EOP09_17125 [Pseudomonadota bacterium]
MIGSWKTGAKSHGDGKWPHDSREKYEDDAELKKNYPLDRIQACCIPLLPSAWTKRVRKDVQDILDEMDWDNAQQYVGFLEAWLIQKFIGCFGDKPRLNTRIEGEGESKFTEAKLDEHLLALERDVVESSFHIVPYDDGSRVFLHKSLAEHVMASLQSSGIRVEIDDEPLEDYEADAVAILHEVKHAGSAERVDYDAYTPSRSEFCLLIDPSTDAVRLESALHQALRTYEPEFLEYFVANPDSGEVTLVREPNPTLSLNAADSAEQSSS